MAYFTENDTIRTRNEELSIDRIYRRSIIEGGLGNASVIGSTLKMEVQYNDGGRSLAGYVGTTGDCAVRAIAIATDKPYQEVYDAINFIGSSERTGKRKRGTSNARTGVYPQAVRKYMLGLGWKWTPTMLIGQGCKTHLRNEELPSGRLVVNISKHYVAVIDGVIHDTIYSDSITRGGTRCVYGYYSQ